jgi:predicted ATP-grasp superfamily ATP-dependent carboligase
VKVDTPVVVAYRGGNAALAAARTLGRLGVRVYYAGERTGIGIEESRYWTDRFWWDFDSPRDETLQFFLRVAQSIGARPILLGVTDWTAMFVDEYAGRLKEYYDFPQAAPGTLEKLISKWGMFGVANELGIPTPRTWMPRTRQDVVDFIGGALFPVVVKAADPAAAHPPPKGIAGDAAELLRMFDEAAPGDANMVLQEYIPGGADSVWMCNAYLDASARCRAAYTGRKLRQVNDTGIASLAVTESNPTVADQTRRLLEGTGYRGLAGVGYKYDPRDGRYKLLDVNARLSGVFRLFRAVDGMDVVRLCYLDLTGQKLPESVVLPGRKWMLEQDAFCALRCMRERKLTFWQWLKSMQGVRELHWFAFDDPAPGIAWFRSTVWPRLVSRAQRLRGRRRNRVSPAAS